MELADLKRSLSHIELEFDVTLGKNIGSGSFSTVNEVNVYFDPSSSEPTLCTAKQLLVELNQRVYYKRLESVCKALWKPGQHKVEHPNLVRFEGVWFSSRADLPQLIYEKMDTCLAEFLKTNREQSALLLILRGVFCGLEFLHHFEKPVVHGDLTANSIFINGNGLVAKIGDLGVCEILGKGICPSRSTSSYKSPESYKSDHVPQVTDDIYSSGVLMIHTLQQKYPESQSQPDDPERFSAYIEQLKTHPLHDYTVACLKAPSERPSAADILEAVENAVSSYDGAGGHYETTSSLQAASSYDERIASLQVAVVSQHMLKASCFHS